ncbi:MULTISPECIES: MFS transporter [unclassified Streptomyces]|uniref:MFS transporter n=1 Tax=unclassified Streptomyces TaxID=2593676 RepID=UPI002254F85F|nr:MULTISPECIES: MFS transporter [unclassified Streptomyces]MCX4991226.1 MFS transporter [Streptomyces sp. NBC_00568]MCX5003537.1 MFS transporter [Streptomyces sp. NBC_00638]
MAHRRPPDRFDRRLIAPMVLGSVLNPVNSSMIAVALVPIGSALGAPPAETAWLVSGLYLATAVGQPVVGRLVDMYGPRRLYLAGTATVGIAGLLGALSPNLGALVAARVLLGFGTSAAYPAAMHLTRSEAERTGQDSPAGVLTALAVPAQTVAVVGPTLGGLLIGAGGWRTIFLVNVPLSLACLVLGALRLPKVRKPTPHPAGKPPAHPVPPTPGTTAAAHPNSIAPEPPGPNTTAPNTPAPEPATPRGEAHASVARRIDLVGMALFAALLVSLMLFLMEPRAADWYLPVLGLVAGAGFARRELRVPEPFIDLRVLGGNRPVLATYLRQFLSYTTAYAFLYGFTQWLEEGRGLHAAAAGLVLLPLSLSALVVSGVTGRREAVRGKLVMGGLVQIAGCVGLLTVHAGSAIWLLAAFGALMGVPQGLNGLANQNALYRQADPARMGSAAGLLRTSTYLGAMAASAAGAVFFTHGADTGGLHRLTLFMLAGAVLLLAVTLIDRSLRELTPRKA